MTSNIFDIWTVILGVKLHRVNRNYITSRNPLSFCVRTLLSREHIFGSNACSKKYFTFEQPHRAEQNTLIVIDIKRKDRVEKAYTVNGCVEIMSCCVCIYVSKCLTNGGIKFGELSGKCENCNWE